MKNYITIIITIINHDVAIIMKYDLQKNNLI